MSRKSVAKPMITLLLAGALLLPIVFGVVLAVSFLLAAMDDVAGGTVLKYLALGCGMVWIVDLIALVLTLGLHSLTDTDQGE